ncbi:hypothetical protein K438DRAFT_505126 [Mycena galopus ATCC 62051]|nr:hypothetical protein K438DRAFT_505126 [Mycena galopus ATCC 62051]
MLPTLILKTIGSTVRSTLRGPSNIPSILLIIGGDVISRALAQLTGPSIVPIAFSFGWVAYSCSMLINVFGDGRLLPLPDYPVKLFNIENGRSCNNRSWVLGRLVRDMEPPVDENVALNLSIHIVVREHLPSWDWCSTTGFALIPIQLGIAAIPYRLYDDWSSFMLTGSGIILSLAMGALPQWRLEKYTGRRERPTGKVVALTRGNPSRYVLVIIDRGQGIDLEDLAKAQSPTLRLNADRRCGLRVTQLVFTVLAFLWIVFFITWTRLETNTLFLLAVGSLGMLQNAIVAGAKRSPAASGIHLQHIEDISNEQVEEVLKDAEMAYPGLGEVLLGEFNSVGHLGDNEKRWWDGRHDQRDLAAIISDTTIDHSRELYRSIVAKKVEQSPASLSNDIAPEALAAFSDSSRDSGYTFRNQNPERMERSFRTDRFHHRLHIYDSNMGGDAKLYRAYV